LNGGYVRQNEVTRSPRQGYQDLLQEELHRNLPSSSSSGDSNNGGSNSSSRYDLACTTGGGSDSTTSSSSGGQGSGKRRRRNSVYEEALKLFDGFPFYNFFAYILYSTLFVYSMFS